MGKLKDISAKLRTLTPEAVDKIILNAFKEHERIVIGMNQEQLLEGKDSLDKTITPQYRSDSYANYKLKLNPLGVVDLKLKGSFYNGFFLQANQFPLYLFSTDEKTRMLAGKYGADIFGIDKTNLDGFSKTFILTAVQNKFKEVLHV